MITSSDIPSKELRQQGECCWHCRYYVRQTALRLDGSLGAICTVDRQPNIYAVDHQLNEGDKTRAADDLCEKFEFDLPPTQY